MKCIPGRRSVRVEDLEECMRTIGRKSYAQNPGARIERARKVLAKAIKRIPTTHDQWHFTRRLHFYTALYPELQALFGTPQDTGEFRVRALQTLLRQPPASWNRKDAYHHQLRALRFGGGALSFFGLLLPKRLAKEDIGDALEMMHALACQGCASWRIYLKAMSTVFWVSLNALCEISGAILGKVKAGSR